MRPRVGILVAMLLAVPVLRAQSVPAWTSDSSRAAVRKCADLRFPLAHLADASRDRHAAETYRRAAAAGDARAAAECLVGRSDARALAGDLAFMVDSISGFLRILDSLGERRHATDLRLMRGGSLIAPGILQLARDDLSRSMTDAHALRDSVLEFWSAVNLAQALYASGDPTAAFSPARRAIGLARSAAERAMALSLEADILAGQARWQEAAARYDSSATLSRLARYEGGVAHALELRGSMAMRLKDWATADSVLADAVRTLRGAGFGGNAAQLNYLQASVALQRGNLPAARRHLRAASSGAVGEGNLPYFIKAREAEVYWREGDLDGAARRLSEAADAMDRYRATLTRYEVRLTAFESSPDDSDPDAGIASIVAALVRNGRARGALNFIERGRAQELRARLEGGASPDDGLAGLRQQLPVGAAFIEYVVGRGGEPTSVFLVTRDTLRGFVTTPVDDLEPSIGRMRSILEGNGDAGPLAASLGAALLGDVFAVLPTDVSTLVIAPDGALHRVPFDVLRLPDGRFVFERLATSVVPSGAVARALLAKAGRHSQGVVTVGAAVYPTTGPNALPALPDADRELAMVSRLSPATTVLRGPEATSRTFAAAANPARQVIHVATHARADEYGVVDGALMLSAEGDDDGVLSALELLNLRIDADLVVLSACRSGVGQLVRGEGMQSLTAPFLAGGTRSLLASMWLVGDRSTVPLMTQFYEELAAGHAVAEALRRARWRAWDRGAPPREWAAFIAVGDPFVRVEIDAPGGSRPWMAVALIACALTAILVYRRIARKWTAFNG